MRSNPKPQKQPPKPHNRAFGTVLARLRRSLRMSQEVLAFESDLTREFISLLERGQRSPTLDTQLALCKALSVSLDEMAALVISEIKRQPTDASST